MPHEAPIRREPLTQTRCSPGGFVSEFSYVREVGLKAAEDSLVWNYAKDHDLVIVSKDADMHQRCFVFGAPPKVVWVRLGNCSTTDVANLLRRHIKTLEVFEADDVASFLSLS